MKQAPTAKQWAMNRCLAGIGLHHRAYRKRAIDIGKRVEVFIDYPASPGCTPPYGPVWFAETVPRRERGSEEQEVQCSVGHCSGLGLMVVGGSLRIQHSMISCLSPNAIPTSSPTVTQAG